MRTNVLAQKVNFFVAVLCMGSAALLAIVIMLEASEMENPIATRMAAIMVQQEL